MADADQLATDNHVFYGSGTFRNSQVDGKGITQDKLESASEFEALYESDYQRLQQKLDLIQERLFENELNRLDHVEPSRRSSRFRINYFNFWGWSMYRRLTFKFSG